MYISVHVCVCVRAYVCVRERGNERDRYIHVFVYRPVDMHILFLYSANTHLQCNFFPPHIYIHVLVCRPADTHICSATD